MSLILARSYFHKQFTNVVHFTSVPLKKDLFFLFRFVIPGHTFISGPAPYQNQIHAPRRVKSTLRFPLKQIPNFFPKSPDRIDQITTASDSLGFRDFWDSQSAKKASDNAAIYVDVEGGEGRAEESAQPRRRKRRAAASESPPPLRRNRRRRASVRVRNDLRESTRRLFLLLSVIVSLDPQQCRQYPEAELPRLRRWRRGRCSLQSLRGKASLRVKFRSKRFLLECRVIESQSRDSYFGFRYSQEQLFNVVAAVDMYRDFLPWCQRSDVLRQYPDGSFDAELEIGFKFLVESYVSHVELERPKRVKVRTLMLLGILAQVYCSFFSQ